MASPRSLLRPLLLAALVAAVIAKCGEDYEDSKHLQELRKKLLCRYDADAGPTVRPGGQTSVRVQLLRTRMDVDEAKNSMTLYGYLMFIWPDEWLQWAPAEYANLTRIYVEASEIWTPKVATLEAPNKVFSGGQALIMNGTVVWTVLTPVVAPCVTDATRWPYDVMSCNFSLVNLSPSTAKMEKSRFQISLVKRRNKGWSMTKMKLSPFAGIAGTAFQDGLLLQVVAQRNSDQHEACVVVPSAAVGWLLLASLWLPADSPHRPMLLCSVILTQVLLNVAVAMRIEVVGTHAPGVLLLLRDSLLVSAAALLQWLLARWLLTLPEDHRPVWPLAYLADVAHFAASPGGARLGQVLVLPATTMTSAPGRKTASMAALTDRAAFLVLVAATALLAIRLMP